MKLISFLLLIFLSGTINAQTLQLHYDARHTVDPKSNAKNFTTLQFDYFKQLDTGKTFAKPGAFFLKIQADMVGDDASIGKYYMQVSQEVRFWRPKIFINLQYSGGLGVTQPKQYSYYIQNAYQAGISYPFKIGTAYFSSVLNYKYVAYDKPSNDVWYTFYFYKGLWNYNAEFAGDFSLGTENKNHGDDFTANLHGKRFLFFAEPQFWYKAGKTISFGTKLNIFYHILSTEDKTQAYPTLGIRVKL